MTIFYKKVNLKIFNKKIFFRKLNFFILMWMIYLQKIALLFTKLFTSISWYAKNFNLNTNNNSKKCGSGKVINLESTICEVHKKQSLDAVKISIETKNFLAKQHVNLNENTNNNIFANETLFLKYNPSKQILKEIVIEQPGIQKSSYEKFEIERFFQVNTKGAIHLDGWISNLKVFVYQNKLILNNLEKINTNYRLISIKDFDTYQKGHKKIFAFNEQVLSRVNSSFSKRDLIKIDSLLNDFCCYQRMVESILDTVKINFEMNRNRSYTGFVEIGKMLSVDINNSSKINTPIQGVQLFFEGVQLFFENFEKPVDKFILRQTDHFKIINNYNTQVYFKTIDKYNFADFNLVELEHITLTLINNSVF